MLVLATGARRWGGAELESLPQAPAGRHGCRSRTDALALGSAGALARGILVVILTQTRPGWRGHMQNEMVRSAPPAPLCPSCPLDLRCQRLNSKVVPKHRHGFNQPQVGGTDDLGSVPLN